MGGEKRVCRAAMCDSHIDLVRWPRAGLVATLTPGQLPKSTGWPAYYRDLIADGAATGGSKDALYRVRRRMGLVAKDGVWGLPEAAVQPGNSMRP